MKNNCLKNWVSALSAVLIVLGCAKNDTKYYADEQDKGIAIFSNTGNDLATCFMAGKPWRTVARTTSGFSTAINYEVQIKRQPATNAKDTLIIQWLGYYEANRNNEGFLSLHLAMPANFTFRDLSALEGKRFNINSTNGFFETGMPDFNRVYVKGKGNIFFKTAQFDSLAQNTFTGNISGLFDADFGFAQITRGRFDHFISLAQIRL